MTITITFKCSCGRTFNSKAEVNEHARNANAARQSGEVEHEGAIIISPNGGYLGHSK